MRLEHASPLQSQHEVHQHDLHSVHRYLSTVGEGASAQVLLAADELRLGAPPVVLKVMKRQLAFAGQKVSAAVQLRPSVG